MMKRATSPISATKQTHKITHVIFDLDGTLIDSESYFPALQAECLKKFGKTYDPKNKKLPVGRTNKEEIKSIIKLYELNVTEDEYLDVYEANYERFLKDCTALSGADRLIQHLYQHNIPTAICSNTTQFHFDVKIKKFSKWVQMIPLKVIAGSDPEIKNPKPSPEPFIVTMNRFAEKPKSPQNVLVFEDSITGVVSALNAGANVVMIPQTPSDDFETRRQIEEIRPKLAALLTNLNEFQPEKFGLPPFN